MTGSTIHPTAIIAEGAIIGAGNVVGPYSVIGPNVILGPDNRIGPHVVIEGHTIIGSGNSIFSFAAVGNAPQDLKFHGEASLLKIGKNNIIREYVTLQPGTKGGTMETVIGDQNLFMANSHVGHDGIVGNNNVIANSSALAGHVTVGNRVTIGGLTGIHQFVRLGDYCMLGAGSMVNKDIPPYCIAQGDRAGLVGINTIGLERAQFASEDITTIRGVYRKLFMGKGLFAEKLKNLSDEHAANNVVGHLLKFISESERGITLSRRASGNDV